MRIQRENEHGRKGGRDSVILEGACFPMPLEAFVPPLSLGLALCGQNPDTSPWILGRQFPLCWRCSGLWGLLVLGLAALPLLRRRAAVGSLPGLGWAVAVLAVACAAMALDVFGVQAHYPNNVTRLATGAMVGLAAAWVVLEAWAILVEKEADPQDN